MRFRQLVVNSIIATDIADKELKFLREARWENAFAHLYNEDIDETNNAKATVMIDTLMQASDISHTMQHWHVYRVSAATAIHRYVSCYIFDSLTQLPLTMSSEMERKVV